jgi:hypothetical protein
MLADWPYLNLISIHRTGSVRENLPHFQSEKRSRRVFICSQCKKASRQLIKNNLNTMLICSARNNADGWSLSHWHLPAVVIRCFAYTQHSPRMWTAAALVIKYLSAAHRGKENHTVPVSVFFSAKRMQRERANAVSGMKNTLDFHAAPAFCFVRTLLCVCRATLSMCTVSFSINLNLTCV